MTSLAGSAAVPGTVHLVGAGPGDPALITLRGARLLESCTLVASDRLVAPELLELVPVGVTRLDVGKRLGAGWRQEEIDGLIVDAARAGHAVVRLKGGDPFVLGRGGEEAAACVAAGVPFEVVPGITSAIAAPAAAGIPVTHRGLAPAFAVVTGHEDPTKPGRQVDWAALAVFPGTLLVLMGMGSLANSTTQLIANGRCPMTPAAAVQWGTTSRQRVVEAPLGELAAAVSVAGLGAPATIVIGDVVAMRRVLATEPALVGAA
jgi:uroporphyrin-III C-methyltransferase